MAAKKTTKTTTPKATKGKATKAAKALAVTPDQAAPAAVETATAPTPETTAPAAKKTRKAKAAPKAKKEGLSMLDAAAKVLAGTDAPMDCKTMIETMSTKGLWTSPKGKTPAATLSAALHREIKVKAKESRFRKADRGQFGLAATV